MKKKLMNFFGICFALVLTACGGSSSSTDSSSNTDSLVSMDIGDGGVSDGETGVSLTPSIVLSFAVPVDPNTVGKNTITLSTPEISANNSKLITDGLILISNITANQEDTTFHFSPSAALLKNTKYCVLVNDVLTHDGAQLINDKFCFTTGETSIPKVSIISPSNKSVEVSLSPSVQVKFSTAVKNVNLANVTLHKGSVDGPSVPIDNIIAGANNTYVFSPYLGLDAQTDYYVVLGSGIKDWNDNQLATTVFMFTTVEANTSAPTVTSVNPGNNDEQVSTKPSIQIKFSEPVLNVNFDNVRLHETTPDGDLVPIDTITPGDNNTYTFRPTTTLKEQTLYYIVLDSAITDNNGNRLNGITTLYFQTGDFTSPNVNIISPSSNASNVPINTVIKVQFSSDVKYITAANVVLYESSPNGIPVRVKVEGPESNDIYSIIPSRLLNEQTSYYLVLESNITDSVGNRLSGNREFSFSTASLNNFYITGGGAQINNYDSSSHIFTNLEIGSLSKYRIASNGSTFVSVGELGTIIVSTDAGVTWSSPPSGTTNNIGGVAYGNGKFVATGDKGLILTSTDGMNWETQATSTNEIIFGVSYIESQFVAVGGNGIILTSSNGADWKIESNVFVGNDLLTAVTSDNKGRFVSVSQGGAIYSATGGDLTTWTQDYSSGSTYLFGVAYGNNTFVAVGDNNTILIYSEESQSLGWQKVAIPEQADIFGVTFANGKFVAVGSRGVILTSTNGKTWDSTTSPDGDFFGVSYGSGNFVAVGDSGQIITSSDNANNWTNVQTNSTGKEDILGLAYNNAIAVGVGRNGLVVTSVDRKSWTKVDVGIAEDINSVVYANNQFTAVANNGIILKSLNGVTWSNVPSNVTNNLYSITYAADKFVVVGDNVTLTSTDGDAWAALANSANLRGVSYCGDFVAVGDNGKILLSENGSQWTSISQNTTENLYAIACSTNRLIAVGSNGQILTANSVSKSNVWNSLVVGNNTYSGIAYGNGKFVAVGYSGISMVSSDNGVTWTPPYSIVPNGINNYAVIPW